MDVAGFLGYKYRPEEPTNDLAAQHFNIRNSYASIDLRSAACARVSSARGEEDNRPTVRFDDYSAIIVATIYIVPTRNPLEQCRDRMLQKTAAAIRELSYLFLTVIDRDTTCPIANL